MLQLYRKIISLARNGGYRNERAYGSGVRSLTEVVAFETKELGNTDIYDTLKRVYSVPLDLRVNRDKLNEQVFKWVENVMQASRRDINVIWVCYSLQSVITHYGTSDNLIFNVRFNGDFLIISDLGDEGCLVAYKTGCAKSRRMVGV